MRDAEKNTSLLAYQRAPNVMEAGRSAISLFSGCGGLDLGFHCEGFRTLAAYDIDRTVTAVYNANLAPVAGIADLTNVDPGSLPVDVLLAGAPCQGFSTVGKRHADDPRNGLLMRAGEIALRLRPRIFILENVPAVVSGLHRLHWERVEDMLRWYGYNVRRLQLQGEDSGIAQRRRRLFLVCWIGSDCIRIEPEPTPAPSLRITLSDLAGLRDHDIVRLPKGSTKATIARHIGPGQKLSNVRLSKRAVPTWQIPEVFGHTNQEERVVLASIVQLRRRARRRDFGDADPVLPETIDKAMGRSTKKNLDRLIDAGYLRNLGPYVDLRHTYNGKYRRLRWGDLSPTVDTHFGDAALFLHPDEDRGFTPREAARIQGFPDHFRLAGSRREKFKMIGNAVPPPMAARLARFIRLALL